MTEYPWMQNICYEPAPLRRSRRLSPLLILAALAMVCGALIALEPIYEAMK